MGWSAVEAIHKARTSLGQAAGAGEAGGRAEIDEVPKVTQNVTSRPLGECTLHYAARWRRIRERNCEGDPPDTPKSQGGHGPHVRRE